MQRSDEIKEFAAAFVKAQAALQHAEKDAKNKAFNSSYATLASVIDAVRPALNEQGISIVQAAVESETGVGIQTTLLHSSGEWISSITYVPVGAATAHGVGAAYTYAKRYGLASICGISAETDDDGNQATRSAEGRRPTGVARTVVDETGIKPDENRIMDVLIALRDCLEMDDEPGAFEVLSELDNDFKVVMWTRLDSKERARIKKIMAAHTVAA